MNAGMNRDSPLVRRFRSFTALSSEEVARLHALEDYTRTVAARRDLIREGEPPRAVFLIQSGWAFRYKTLEDGRRQVLQFLLPGDLCDVHADVLNKMDHSIGTMTEVTFAEVPFGRLEELGRDHPNLRRALRWQSMTVIAMQREWTVNIGQRNAYERVGHLFCELFLRLHAVGLTQGRSCDMPATQIDLGEAMGLTPVHINRMVQELRKAGLIVLTNRTLTIPDLDALQDSALFSPDYLHLGNKAPGQPSVGVDAPRTS